MAIDPLSFAQSRAVRSYNPQFLDTSPVTTTTSAAGNQPDLANRMLQLMSGDLKGTLSSGDKLSALGALLKSVSRGSQTTPQQVIQGLQQQKMAEIQGQLQIQELRKAAAEKAQREAFLQSGAARITDPAERDLFMSLTDKGKEEYLLKKITPREYGATSAEREAVSLGLKPGSDAYKAYITAAYGQAKYIQTPQGTAEIPGMQISYQEYKDPDTGEAKRAIIIGGKAYAI